MPNQRPHDFSGCNYGAENVAWTLANTVGISILTSTTWYSICCEAESGVTSVLRSLSSSSLAGPRINVGVLVIRIGFRGLYSIPSNYQGPIFTATDSNLSCCRQWQMGEQRATNQPVAGMRWRRLESTNQGSAHIPESGSYRFLRE